MARSIRLVGAVVLACASVPLLGVSPAHAETRDLAAASSGYFYAQGIDKPDAAPQAPPNLTAEADGVAVGHLAVAATGGSEDKVSALYFELGDLDPAGVITKAVLTVPLAEATGGNVAASAAPEKVRACKAGGTGFGGEDGAAIALAPARLCEVFASGAGKATADGKAYTFDITALAATWLTVNDGVVLTPSDGALTTSFQVVFLPGDQAKLALDYTAPPAAPVVPVDVPVDGSGGGIVDGGTSVTPDLGGFGGGVAPAPPVDGGLGSAPAPTVGELPAPTVGVAPQPAVAAPATVPVAFVSPSMRPTGVFWIGGLVLVAVLALLSLVMGDSSVPVKGAGTQSKLARTLSARERGVTVPRLSGPSLA